MPKLQLTSPNGGTLNTAGTYCDTDIEIIPKLQDKTVTESGTVTADEGYVGLGSVTVNVEGGGGSGNSPTFETPQFRQITGVRSETFTADISSGKISLPQTFTSYANENLTDSNFLFVEIYIDSIKVAVSSDSWVYVRPVVAWFYNSAMGFYNLISWNREGTTWKTAGSNPTYYVQAFDVGTECNADFTELSLSGYFSKVNSKGTSNIFGQAIDFSQATDEVECKITYKCVTEDEIQL